MDTEDKIYADLSIIIRDVLMQDDLQLSPGLSAPQVDGWDSFKNIEIILATEGHWGIRFTTIEIDNLKNVGDLVETILKKLTNG